MLLTITTTHPPATDLGYLLCKHPGRYQTFELAFGHAHVFYPEATPERCTAALVLQVDPVALVRGDRPDHNFTLGQYVNDRPYVASSFMSVAIAQVFSSALNGVCKTRPELVATPMPLTATVEVLPASGGEGFVRGVFEPLGYEVACTRHALDPHFPEWGLSRYVTLTLTKLTTVAELLAQLYVLIPVFDDKKHYFVGEGEVEKLLARGAGWLAAHPLRDAIARRYLRHRASLTRLAIERLQDELEPDPGESGAEAGATPDAAEAKLETPLRLNDQRHEAVAELLRESGAARVVDLGCGEGKLLRRLVAVRQFTEILGVDVSVAALQVASRRLKLDDAVAPGQLDRVRLLQGSLVYRDARIAGYDAAAVVEVIEHLDPPRLAAFGRVVFEFARPRAAVVTTPNKDYNVVWPALPAGEFRHADHRFEWTRAEFEAWARGLAAAHGYAVTFRPIGPPHADHGPPTQAAVFTMAVTGAVAEGRSHQQIEFVVEE